MSEDWDFYLCRVNDQLASIFLDLSLRPTIPDPSRPWLLYVWLEFNQPRPDGLSSSEESEVLFKIDDALTSALKKQFDAILVGRITTSGRREFYFYSATVDGFEDAVARCISRFEGYKYADGTKKDPGWSQYLDVLYPPEEELRRLRDRGVIKMLQDKGDTLETPREVDHFAYFQNGTDASDFAKAAQVLGYRIQSTNNDEDTGGKFYVSLSRAHPVDPEAIHKVTMELESLSKCYHGDYDGWGCLATVAPPKNPWWKPW